MPKPIATTRSPYFQYDFKVKGRRFHGSTGCASKRDAQTYIDNFRREILLGNGKPEIALDEACLSYWQDKGQHEANSGTTKYQLANLCAIIGKKAVLSSIGIPEFRAFIAKRRGQGVSNASINREWQLARRVWKHIEDSYATGNIKWGALRLDEPKERVRELKADEQERLFAALPDDLKPVVEFAILSGQRRSAIVALRWDKIDWQAGEATIVNKGGAPHAFPLSPAMVQLVLQQPKLDDCPFVFTYVCERHSPARKDRPRRVKGKRYPFSEEGWNRKWYKALADAGISDFRFHDLRHTSATRLVRQTGNIKAASRLLGHTDIRTTSRYAHVGMEDLRSMMAATESRKGSVQNLTKDAERRTNTEETKD